MEQILNGLDWHLDRSLFYQILLTAVFIALFFISKGISRRLVRKSAKSKIVTENRILIVVKFFNFLLFGLFSTLIALVWNISFEGLSVYFATFFTVSGIALFAAWSILSNVTASVILFFYFPYRIGTKVRIIDGDNSVEGTVDDINIFSIKILTKTGELVSYPNNLAIQKPILQIKNND